jgi:hypothetical protein
MSCFLFLTVEVGVLGLNEDNFLMTYTFQKDGVAKIEGAAEIAETVLTGEKGKGYWVLMDCNTKREPEERKTAPKVMPSSPLGVILEEVIQSIETVDMKLREFFEIHGTDLQISREIRSNSRRRK